MNFLKPGDFSFQQHCLETYGSIENLIDKAKNGEIIAQADLGVAYSEGFGDLLPKDNDKAIGWLTTAVERGYEFPSILGKLGELLDRKGTPLHQRKAYGMYHRAANLGDTTSQMNLAEMYRCGVDGVVNEDLNEAFKWLKRAAGEDLSDHGRDLGALTGLLVGTMKKVENAVVGSRHRALMLLYTFYLKGDCPERRPQPTKAVYYLTRAAELGDTEAQLELGQIYLTGNYEQVKDIVKARRWLQKASAQGVMKAKQLLDECKHIADTQHDMSEVSAEAFVQSCGIMNEKRRQRCEANLHPFVITQPVAFSEEMLSEFDSSPTARIYLQAFKLVKEGFEILFKSNLKDKRGITLIAHGFLTENSILQAFPMKHSMLPQIFQLCEKTLQKDPCFFEGLVISFAMHHLERNISVESSKVDHKKVMGIKNVIYLIQEAEPNGLCPEDPLSFDKNYSSWLHVLYEHLASIYVVAEADEKAAEAFENSLKCCPSDFDSKRGLGYCLMSLYCSKLCLETEACSQGVPTELLSDERKVSDREISKYASWTTKELGDTAEKILKEYLAEAPPCWKTYPNVCYYLANIAFLKTDMKEFRKYYELGQDAEAKRLPFLQPVNLPLKDDLSAAYQLLPNIQKPIRCGNIACTKKYKESELKFCSRCGNQKYCSKECQIADWKNHKATCKAVEKT